MIIDGSLILKNDEISHNWMLKKSIILLKHVGLILFVSKKVLSALMLLLDRKQLFWASRDF